MSSFPDLLTAFEEAIDALKVKLSTDESESTTYNGEEIKSIAGDIAEQFVALQALFAADSGAALVGTADGITVQEKFNALVSDLAELKSTTGAALIGTSSGSDVQSELDALTANQQSGVIVFQTYALLTAYTPTAAQETGSFKVVNDDDSSLNGYYSWSTGTTYIKDADLVVNEIDEDNASDAVSGSAVYSHVATETGSILKTAPTGYKWCVLDPFGNVVLAIKDDGTVIAGKLDAESASGALLEVYEKADTIDYTLPTGFTWGVMDNYGRMAFGMADDGTFKGYAISASDAEIKNLNGYDVDTLIALVASSGGTIATPNLDADIAITLSYGQSLSVGADGTPPVSTTQTYSNVMLDTGIIHSSSYEPTSLISAVEETQETPCSGAGDMIQQLIATENALDYTEHNYQIGEAATGSGGTQISGLVKGTTSYTKCTDAFQQFTTLANTDGKLAKCLGWFWTQAESDYINDTSAETYKAAFEQLVLDMDADCKAITGQSEDLQCISYQVQGHSTYGYPNDPYLAVAQWEMSKDIDNYHVACPLYWSTESVHQSAEHYKILGAYYGLCYKRVVVDKADWTPTQPNNVDVQDNVTFIKFDVPSGELAIDVTLNALVDNYGFTYVDADDVAYSITSVDLVNKNTIRIITDETVTTGSKLQYGHGNGVTGGNIRDTQGDSIAFDPTGINHPMHNWCVIFELTI